MYEENLIFFFISVELLVADLFLTPKCPDQILITKGFLELLIFSHSVLTPGLIFRDWAGFHIGMDRNFVCLWRRHNCRSQVIDLSLSALIS
jgi:hypothetical protein